MKLEVIDSVKDMVRPKHHRNVCISKDIASIRKSGINNSCCAMFSTVNLRTQQGKFTTQESGVYDICVLLHIAFETEKWITI